MWIRWKVQLTGKNDTDSTNRRIDDMTTATLSGIQKIKSWIVLARPPFHTVGVLPFALGAVLAYRATGTFHWALWGWGTLAVVLIMLSTYLAGEYFDYEGDKISRRVNPNRFAGGSGVLPAGLLDRRGTLVGASLPWPWQRSSGWSSGWAIARVPGRFPLA